MDFIVELLKSWNVLAYVITFLAVVAGFFLAKLRTSTKSPILDDILKAAKIAVLAVEKLDEAQKKYEGLSKEEKAKRKKEDAKRFVMESLRTEFGIKQVNPVTEFLIDFAIEAVLKQLNL